MTSSGRGLKWAELQGGVAYPLSPRVQHVARHAVHSRPQQAPVLELLIILLLLLLLFISRGNGETNAEPNRSPIMARYRNRKSA